MPVYFKLQQKKKTCIRLWADKIDSERAFRFRVFKTGKENFVKNFFMHPGTALHEMNIAYMSDFTALKTKINY